jgi:hypothetical protein
MVVVVLMDLDELLLLIVSNSGLADLVDADERLKYARYITMINVCIYRCDSRLLDGGTASSSPVSDSSNDRHRCSASIRKSFCIHSDSDIPNTCFVSVMCA